MEFWESTLELGVHGVRSVSDTQHEAWVSRMLRNLRIKGMAAEDGPRLGGLGWSQN